MGEPHTYIEQHDRVIEPDNRFSLVMSIALNPKSDYREGIIRCITNREGSIFAKDNVDYSALYKLSSNTLSHFDIGEKLNISGEKEIAESLKPDGFDYLGLEDPDIWIDKQTGRIHLYCTMPFVDKSNENNLFWSLGHAEGDDLNSLVMTGSVLMVDKEDTDHSFAKEVSIAPVNKDGVRLNLFESRYYGDFYSTDANKKRKEFSTVRVAVADDMGKRWKWGDTVFNPAENNIKWIAEHASPGPLMPRDFIDVGGGKLLGFINGRGASHMESGKIIYDMFSVGLFIYDYENGHIDWVSKDPMIQDSEAKTITFASQFVVKNSNEGVLYAHVDDSFVRAYTINADALKKILP